MKEEKVCLFSKIFTQAEKDDPDYLDTLAIKALFEKQEIPYEEFSDKSHIGDPRIRLEGKVYKGIKEIRDSLFFLTDYFHPERRS